MRTRVRTVVSTLLVAVVALGLAACDSAEEPPQPVFQAEVTGDANRSLSGTAGMASGDETAQSFQGSFAVLTPVLPDSLTPPDSLTLPDSLRQQLPSATVLVLTDEENEANDYGQTITLTFPDERIPEPGTYAFEASLSGTGGLFVGGIMPTSFSADSISADSIRRQPSALYTDYQHDGLTAVPAVAGTIRIQSSSETQVRGRFQFETERAFRLSGLQTLDPNQITVDFPRFNTTIEGTFTARRDAGNRPLVPALDGGIAGGDFGGG